MDANGQVTAAVGKGHGYGRNPGEVDRGRVDVVEVHLQGVVELFAETEGGGRGHGRDQRVAGGKSAGKVFADQGANLLGLAVVRVVVASAQGVGPEHDAALYLGAKTLAARVQIHLLQIGAALGAIAVFDAVVAREIGRCLGHGDDVIGTDAVFGVAGHG